MQEVDFGFVDNCCTNVESRVKGKVFDFYLILILVTSYSQPCYKGPVALMLTARFTGQGSSAFIDLSTTVETQADTSRTLSIDEDIDVWSERQCLTHLLMLFDVIMSHGKPDCCPLDEFLDTR